MCGIPERRDLTGEDRPKLNQGPKEDKGRLIEFNKRVKTYRLNVKDRSRSGQNIF